MNDLNRPDADVPSRSAVPPVAPRQPVVVRARTEAADVAAPARPGRFVESADAAPAERIAAAAVAVYFGADEVVAVDPAATLRAVRTIVALQTVAAGGDVEAVTP